jgi:hypothetical protein
MVQKAFILAHLQVGITFFLVIAITIITTFFVVQGLIKDFEELVCPAV